MKCTIATFTLLALFGVAVCGPISISDNNVGDIITVGVNVEADIKTDIETNLVNILVAILTHIGDLNLSELPSLPQLPESPEQPPVEAALPKLDFMKAIGEVKELISQPGQTKEQKEQVLTEQVQKYIKLLSGKQ